jgi:hypothetical protein
MPMAASDYRALDPGEHSGCERHDPRPGPGDGDHYAATVIAEFADREACTLRLGRFPSPECRCP